jgi:hypothetical protein
VNGFSGSASTLGPYTMSGTAFTVVFISDVSIEYSGFYVDYTAVNPRPTGIWLAGAWSVPENSPVGYSLGLFSLQDCCSDTSLSWTLSGSFALAGNALVVKAGTLLDFETATSIGGNVITGWDSAGQSFAGTFAIAVTNVNEPPTSLTLSASTIAENSGISTVVGSFSATDPDAGSSFTFTLNNNGGGRFSLLGANLVVLANIDFEVTQTIQVTVTVTDNHTPSQSLIRSFTITVVRGTSFGGGVLGGEVVIRDWGRYSAVCLYVRSAAVVAAVAMAVLVSIAK